LLGGGCETIFTGEAQEFIPGSTLCLAKRGIHSVWMKIGVVGIRLRSM
jgi:hypothetical protein